MAKKIGVLQGNSGTPQTYVKKSVALLLVRRLLAVWVVENLTIRRTAVRPVDAIPAGRFDAPRRTYIPLKLPPANGYGIKAIGPVAEQSANCRAVLTLANEFGR